MMASKFSLCLTCKLVKQHRISKSLARSNINPFHQSGGGGSLIGIATINLVNLLVACYYSSIW